MIGVGCGEGTAKVSKDERGWIMSKTVKLLIITALIVWVPAAPIGAQRLAVNTPGKPTVPAPTKAVGKRSSDRFEETTDKSRKASIKGVKWLLRTMNRDGGCGVDIGQPSDIGVTAIVGLALMSRGNTVREGQHSREVRKIQNYLLKQVSRMRGNNITRQTGTQLQRKIGQQAHTFFAALFLSQVVGEDWSNTRARQGLAKLAKAISGSQGPDGSWGAGSWAPMLGTVMGWVSLRGAYSAGFKVGGSADKTANHLISQMGSVKNRGSWMHTLYKNATGVRVLYAMQRQDDAACKAALAAVLKLVTSSNQAFNQAGGEEFLAFHLITETMLQTGGSQWKQWYPVVRDKLCGVQNADGSWTGHHCITSRTFCTAAAVLVLDSPNRMLPISQE
jgi:hypothetical protein